MIRSQALSNRFLNVIRNERYPASAVGKRFMSKSWREEHLEAPQGGATIPDNVSVRQRRIIYRSKQRGWLELDILMGGWAAKHVPKMEDDSAIAEIEHLLDADTPKMLKWVLGQEMPPPEYQTNVMKSLQNYAQAFLRRGLVACDFVMIGMRGNLEADVLEILELVTVFFVRTLCTWKSGDSKDRSCRVRLLPEPAPMCSLLGSLRVIYLALHSHSCIQQNQVLTKRDIYYMCRSLFGNVNRVDRALAILSLITGVQRNDMNIVAAPKGLVVGKVTFVDETANEINVSMFGPDGCLIPSRPERMLQISSDASAVIVIEKEASFQCLLHEIGSHAFFESAVFVTGKGYPDHATRHFLRKLISVAQAKGKHIPAYLLTDADPHGICIAMCYLTSLTEYDVRWLGVRPSDVERDFTIDPRSRLPLQETELNLLPNLLKRCCTDEHINDDEYIKFRNELLFMKTNAVKFEMEALSIIRTESGISGLLLYLIDKIREEEKRQNSLLPFEASAAQRLMIDMS